GEPDLVQPVVHAHLRALDPAQPTDEVRNQGHRQEAMGHRRAERSRSRLLAVHVDPLMVIGVVGEAVDTRLLDSEPVGGAELHVQSLLEVLNRTVDFHVTSAGLPPAINRRSRSKVNYDDLRLFQPIDEGYAKALKKSSPVMACSVSSNFSMG